MAALLIVLMSSACPSTELVRPASADQTTMYATPVLNCQKELPTWRGGLSFRTTLMGAFKSWEDATWWACVVYTDEDLVMAPMQRARSLDGRRQYRVDLKRAQTESLQLSRVARLHLVCRLLGEPSPRYSFQWDLAANRHLLPGAHRPTAATMTRSQQLED